MENVKKKTKISKTPDTDFVTPLDLGTIGSNHTGYIRGEGAGVNRDGDPYYVVRPEGTPGAGVIYVEADEHIVTSIWTGKPLYGGKSVR